MRHVRGVFGDQFPDREHETASEPRDGGRSGRSPELDERQPGAGASAAARPLRKSSGGRAAERDPEDHRRHHAGEGVDRGPEEQGGESRPADFGGHRGEPGERRDPGEGQRPAPSEPRAPGCLSRTGNRGPSESDPDGDPGGQVRTDSTHRRPGEAQFGNQDPGGGHTSDECAHGVRGIEPAGGARFAAVPNPAAERGERRQGGAHEGGGGQEEKRGQHRGGRQRALRGRRRSDEGYGSGQIERQPRRESGCPQFQDQEPSRQPRGPESSARARGQDRTQPESAEEHGEHQRHRGVRRPEHDGEAPHPDDLVGQRREAREQDREAEQGASTSARGVHRTGSVVPGSSPIAAVPLRLRSGADTRSAPGRSPRPGSP